MQRSWLSNAWYDTAYWTVKFSLTLGFGMRGIGGENIPKTGPVLLVANHESYLDPIAIGCVSKRRFSFLARKGLFKNRVFGALLGSLRTYPVDQEGVAKEGLKAVIHLLQQQEPVLVFPEGERTWDGKIQPLKPGILLIMRRVRVPIVPVGISGAFETFPRVKKLPTLSPPFLPVGERGTIAVSIGKPIDSQVFDDQPRDKILTDLFDAIQTEVYRAERLRLKPSRRK